MKIEIISTSLRIYRGHVEQWVPLHGGPAGDWQRSRRASKRDKERIITVR